MTGGAAPLERLQPPATVAAPLLIGTDVRDAFRYARWTLRGALRPWLAGTLSIGVPAAAIGAIVIVLQLHGILTWTAFGAGLLYLASVLVVAVPLIAAALLAASTLIWRRRLTSPMLAVYATADAVLTIGVRRGAWYIANHVARKIGGLGFVLQDQVAVPLNRQQIAREVNLEAKAASPKLQRLYAERWGMTPGRRGYVVRRASEGPFVPTVRPNSTAASG